MIYRTGAFNEYQLAEYIIKRSNYIELYKKDKIAYVPYFDIPSQSKKYIKFIYEAPIGWVYVDNSQ